MEWKYRIIFLLVSLCLLFHDECAYSQSCLVMKYDESGNRLSVSLCDCGSEYKPSVERDILTDGNHEVDEDFELSIYPNPSDGVFEIRVSDMCNDVLFSEVQLMNLQGVMVFSAHFTNSVRIDISDEPSGVYLLKFFSGDVIRTRLVVKI